MTYLKGRHSGRYVGRQSASNGNITDAVSDDPGKEQGNLTERKVTKQQQFAA